MQQDALPAVDFVEWKKLCVIKSDDVLQVRKIGVVEICRAGRYTGGLREAIFLLDVTAVCILGNVCDGLRSCLSIFDIAAHSSDGTTGLWR
jgi:hypothetical protein